MHLANETTKVFRVVCERMKRECQSAAKGTAEWLGLMNGNTSSQFLAVESGLCKVWRHCWQQKQPWHNEHISRSHSTPSVRCGRVEHTSQLQTGG